MPGLSGKEGKTRVTPYPGDVLLPPAHPKISFVFLPGAGAMIWTSSGIGCDGVRERPVTLGQESWFSWSHQSFPFPSQPLHRISQISQIYIW